MLTAAESSRTRVRRPASTRNGDHVVRPRAIVGFVVGFFLFVGWWLAGGSGGLIVGVVLLLLMVVAGGMMRAHNERAARYAWWARGWRDRF